MSDANNHHSTVASPPAKSGLWLVFLGFLALAALCGASMLRSGGEVDERQVPTEVGVTDTQPSTDTAALRPVLTEIPPEFEELRRSLVAIAVESYDDNLAVQLHRKSTSEIARADEFRRRLESALTPDEDTCARVCDEINAIERNWSEFFSRDTDGFEQRVRREIVAIMRRAGIARYSLQENARPLIQDEIRGMHAHFGLELPVVVRVDSSAISLAEHPFVTNEGYETLDHFVDESIELRLSAQSSAGDYTATAAVSGFDIGTAFLAPGSGLLALGNRLVSLGMSGTSFAGVLSQTQNGTCNEMHLRAAARVVASEFAEKVDQWYKAQLAQLQEQRLVAMQNQLKAQIEQQVAVRLLAALNGRHTTGGGR